MLEIHLVMSHSKVSTVNALNCAKRSSRADFLIGVPQGSILTPNLFLLHVKVLVSSTSNPILIWVENSTCHCPRLCRSTIFWNRVKRELSISVPQKSSPAYTSKRNLCSINMNCLALKTLNRKHSVYITLLICRDC